MIRGIYQLRKKGDKKWKKKNITSLQGIEPWTFGLEVQRASTALEGRMHELDSFTLKTQAHGIHNSKPYALNVPRLFKRVESTLWIASYFIALL